MFLSHKEKNIEQGNSDYPPLGRKIMDWIAMAAGNKASWANAGPVLILGLLIYCIVFVSAEKPYHSETSGLPDNGLFLTDGMESPAALDPLRSVPDGAAPLALPDHAEEGDMLASGWAISVDSERTVFLPTIEQAYEVLEDVKESYIPDESQWSLLNTEFIDTVVIYMEEVPVRLLSTPAQALDVLTEDRENIVTYKVKKGDSFWSIANANKMTMEELQQINGVTDYNLQIGQIIKLNRPQPLLSVKTMFTAMRKEDIPFDTVYKDNGNAWVGQDKVLSEGAAGVKEVKYEIAQINGIAVEEIVLSETIISDPVNRIMEKGTKAIVASRSESSDENRGALFWPIRGKINSAFGSRGGGKHSGIDIEAKIGDPVYSAEAGTVIAASSYYDYGNRVVIDHGNGLSTWYAHLSEIRVAVGQVVGAQELVGLAGRTGRTTGPHLHFEVRIDGGAVNPVHYLN